MSALAAPSSCSALLLHSALCRQLGRCLARCHRRPLTARLALRRRRLAALAAALAAAVLALLPGRWLAAGSRLLLSHSEAQLAAPQLTPALAPQRRLGRLLRVGRAGEGSFLEWWCLQSAAAACC